MSIQKLGKCLRGNNIAGRFRFLSEQSLSTVQIAGSFMLDNQIA